ncbi:hypothetical protein U1Q18_017809 [Sarracenia purpurea var. burkii]
MAKTRNNNKPTKQNQLNQNNDAPKPEKPPSWAVLRSLLTRAQSQPPPVQPAAPENQPQKQQKKEKPKEESRKKSKKMKCSGSLCSNTKVRHRPDPPSHDANKKRASMGSTDCYGPGSGSRRSMKGPLTESPGSSLWVSSVSSSTAGYYRGKPFRGFAGCYECRMVVDPDLGVTRSDASIRATICSCPYCGEIFIKAESLEIHQKVRHAVSELGPEETSKNIVEIIFQSSWLTKQSPICKINRILKVQNTPKTISKFEEYRDAIKAKAAKLPKKHPRCIADGNELLRFHCTTVACSLGLDGSSNLGHSIPSCSVCNIIKNGFKIPGGGSIPVTGKGILTTGTSGKAQENADVKIGGDDRRAMLVCRVIAGRVKKNVEGSMEEYDSVTGPAEFYPNVDELYVFNPRAILPCFVLIYSGF